MLFVVGHPLGRKLHTCINFIFPLIFRVAIIKANFLEKRMTKMKEIYNDLLTTILYNIYG